MAKCETLKERVPSLESGYYTVEYGGNVITFYCDMVVDNGMKCYSFDASRIPIQPKTTLKAIISTSMNSIFFFFNFRRVVDGGQRERANGKREKPKTL